MTVSIRVQRGERTEDREASSGSFEVDGLNDETGNYACQRLIDAWRTSRCGLREVTSNLWVRPAWLGVPAACWSTHSAALPPSVIITEPSTIRNTPSGDATMPGMTATEIAPHTAALMAAACPDINKYGSAFYFTPETVGVGKEHGLDGFRFYFLGRGGVLGDVEAPVVASAFGWWDPALVAKMWNTSRDKMAPREAGRIYLKCAQDHGRARLANVDGLQEFCTGAQQIIAATNPAGLALYAGLAAEPLADDLPGQAMQLLATLRELRGSAHIMAVLASGLEPKLAHAIKRPDMVKSFGYGEDPIPFTDAQKAQLEAAEAITDRLVAPSFDAVSDAPSFLKGLANICAALA